MTWNRFWLSLPLCIVVALLAAFLFVSPAFAQDEVPPEVVPAETPAETLPTEAAPFEVLPTETVPTEVLPTEAAPSEELLAEPTLVEEVPVVEPTLAQTLAEAEVVLSDANGEVISLASNSAFTTLTNSDPYFIYGGVTYRYMTDCTGYPTNCTETSTPIQTAINAIAGGMIPIDGFLHFEAGANITDSAMINGVIGLKGLIGATKANTLEPNVTINGTISISNMFSGFTLDGFNIFGSAGAPDTDPADGIPDYPQGALDFYNTGGALKLMNLVVLNTDPTGQGIAIGPYHAGAVELINVISSDNAGGGAYIQATGAVTSKNSSFERNGGNYYVSGVSIDTTGAVLLDGVSVDNNGPTNSASAAYINNSGPLTIKNSVFNGNSSIWGLTNNTITGAVTLDNVYVNENRAGIWLGSKGNLSANNVHANLNYRNGAVFDTCWDSSVNPYDNLFDQTCTSTIVGNISVTNSEFNNNSSNYAGLSAWAKGSITLTNINASSNRGIDDSLNPTYTTAGARLQNYGSLAVYPITVNNSTFNWNSDDGLEILSKGLVTVNKVHADNNGTEVDGGGNFVAAHDGYGMHIDNISGTTGVTFNGGYWGDNTTYGNAYGLLINSKGNILLNYLESSYNSYVSGRLDNTTGTGNVIVNKSTYIHSWGDFGLHITSNGVVTLNSVTANENYWAGTYIDNTTALSPKAVTINGGEFSYNSDTGLVVFTHGAITLTNISANANTDYDEGDSNYYGSGAFLKNDYLNLLGVQISQPVTVNYSTFEDNRRTGLMIESYGAITLKNVTANRNSEWGAYLDNYAATTPKAVTISNSVFNENSSDGLTLETRGLVNLSGVDASNNSIREGGMNPGDAVHEYVASQADDTWWIYAYQDDVISITLEHGDQWWDPYLELWGFNGSDWEMLTYDDDGGDDNNSQIIDFTMPYEGSYYILAHSFDYSSSGDYTLKYWKGADPGFWNDVYYYDYNGLTVRNANGAGVTITNGSFSNNSGYGIDIETHGAVKLTNVNASDNTSYGAYINNRPDALTTSGVTLVGSTFDNNNNTGLVIQSNGAVLLTKTIANENMGYGASIMNVPAVGTAKPAVTITNDAAKLNWLHTGFSGNYDDGLRVETIGNITLTNVQSNDNWGLSPMVQASGAVLNNESGTGNISMSKSSFNNNVGYGLLLRTNGNATLNGVTANENDFIGASIGTDPEFAKVVAISGMSTFYDNGDRGLEVYATGAITLTNVDSAGNGGYGAYLRNTYGTLPANVSLLGTLSYWTNWFGDNDDEGLHIETSGAVVVNKLDASNNAQYGVYIDNRTGTANVTINTGWYNSNYEGLVLRTKGTVLITSLTASNNTGGVGARINNEYDTSGTKSVTISKSTFNGNSANGLEIGSYGNIIINNITASDNTDGGSGVYLYNRDGTGTVTVLNTLGANTFNSNANHGLWIASDHAVIVTGVTASFNGSGFGIYVDNDDVTNAPVTLTKTTTNYNGLDGVRIHSHGVVTLNNAVAMFNGLDDLGTPAIEAANGFTIYSQNPACRTTFTNSVTIGNGGYGIFLHKNGGSYLLTNTIYFGNNVSGGYRNILIVDGI